MAIPTYEDFMLPLLRELVDGQVHRMRDLYSRLADVMSLSEEERSQKLPSGQQRVVPNRIGWARTYLKHAGLVESPKRGFVTITPLGREVLGEGPNRIDYKYLERFESFREFRSKTNTKTPTLPDEPEPTATPDETIEFAYQQLQDQLVAQLLETLKSCDPYFFERVVLQLLRAMGYGGVSGSGLVTPPAHDAGIDGIIHEDKLGLDTVCIQAKRWEGTVGRPIVQAFVGSMDFHQSRKGVIITTGRFSSDALKSVEKTGDKRVVLIDGERLCRLMIDHKIGVTVRQTYEIAEVSQDFFDADES